MSTWMPGNSVLYVCTSIFNPIQYQSRYKLYREFVKRMACVPYVKLYTAEVAFGERLHQITRSDDPTHLQLRTYSEIWHKERALNLLVETLPEDWKYVAFIDADIQFSNPNWAIDTLNALQHWKIIQMFSEYYDLNPQYQIMNKGFGFIYAYRNGIRVRGLNPNDCYSYTYGGHPGFAHAMTRQAFNETGGLIEHAVLGSADRHMMLSLIGRADESYNENVTQGYKNPILNYQEQCREFIKEKFGYLNSTIMHYFHGNKKDRKYGERWKILVDEKFDQDLDLKKNWQGLFELTDHNPILKWKFYKYFADRNEDWILM